MSLFDQVYWLIGSVIGSVVGSVLNFNTAGIDFSMTALFLVVFVEQWKSTKNHASAITGVEFCYSGDDQYYGNINSDEEIQKRFRKSGREGRSGTCLRFMQQV